MKRSIRRFQREEGGATAIEYVLIAMLVALAIVSGGTLIGKTVANQFNATSNGFASTAS